MKRVFCLLSIIIIGVVICSIGYTRGWDGFIHSRISSEKMTTEEIVKQKVVTPNITHVTSTQDKKSKIISIIGLGDTMIGSNYPANYLPGYDILKNVRKYIEDADFTFANLECAIGDKGVSTKNCDECFSFRMPNSYVKYLKNSGIDVVGDANNHAMDFGTTGKTHTERMLSENSIKSVGYDNQPYTIIEKNGVKVGFCSFAPNGYSGVMHFNDASRIIKELSQKCDIVIANFHAGAEGPAYQHVTRKEEYFLGEDRGNPYTLARKAIDNGADIVFMEGPHVTRAIDLYKGRFISYSLGDFAVYGRFDISGPCGVAPIIKIFVNENGEFQRGKIYPLKLVNKGVPVIDRKGTVIKKIISFMKSDDPEAHLIIGDDGTIRRMSNK